ncbi:MAG: hypothetical protein NC410_11050 [Oscillibacter sp.]|nr:hypothetical protein [Oscillibacter sp.]
MNKGLFLFLLLLLGSLAHAQYGGQWILGERLNFVNGGRVMTETGEKKNNGFMFKVAPSLGYFVRNGLAVGVGVGYEYMKDVNGHQNTFEVTPFVRYDFGGGQVRPFLLAESAFGWGKSDMKKGNDGRHYLWTPALKPGIWIRFTDSLAAEATVMSLRYEHAKLTDLKTDEALVRNRWKFRWLDISFGFNLLFNF